MADATIRPVSAGTGNWDVTTVANINEAITQPSTAGDGTYARHNGASTKIQEWNLTAPSDAGTITGVVVWMRVSCEEDGDNEMSVRIKVNGTWHSLSNSDGSLHDYNEWRQYTGTFSGGAMVGSAPVLEVTGTGSSSSSRGYLHNAYGLLAYTPAPAEQYAVKSGNWNDTTVWSTGVVPTTGTVYSNGYTVTVDANSSATVVTNVAGTVAVAGGLFNIVNGVTLTANVFAGTTTCVTATSNVTANIVGDVHGGSGTAVYGCTKTGNGTLTVTGNCYGGSGTSSYGVQNNSTSATIAVIGNCYGGSGGSAHGVYNGTAGTVTISGNVYGSDVISTAFGVRNNTSGTVTIGGSVYAGASAAGCYVTGTGTTSISGSVYAAGSVVGLRHVGSTNNVTIGGNAVGGSALTAYGVQCESTGSATITGAAISADSPGLGAGVGVTGTGYAIIGSAQTGTGGASPCVGHVHVADLSAATVSVRSSSSVVTLSAEVDLPSPFQPSSVFGGA